MSKRLLAWIARLALATLCATAPLLNAAMSSANFAATKTVVGNGGNTMGSANFSTGSTTGQDLAMPLPSSANFANQPGFWSKGTSVAFTFTPQTSVPVATAITSNTVTISGAAGPTAISIVGGSYSINGGVFTTTAGTVNNGDTVAVQVLSSASFATTTQATLTIGGVSGPFSVTTVIALAFTPQSSVPLSTAITSNTVTISGLAGPTAISIVGGSYSINGGAFVTTAGTINNGDTVAVRVVSSASNATTTQVTLTIGSVSATFSVTTVIALAFTPQSSVPVATAITSNTVTISGAAGPTAISIVGGSYSINGGVFTTTAGTVNNGDTVAVQVLSSASFATTTQATLTIGGVSGPFSVTTVIALAFTPQSSVPLSTAITSNTVTISGLAGPTAISIVGGSYSINGGAFVTTAGTINNGDTVAVRVVSSASNATATQVTLTIGGASATFSATTVIALAFTAQAGVPLATAITSNTLTINGLAGPTAISIAGGSYSINGGAFVTTAGTINSGNTVAVRVVSSASNATTTQVTLTIGSVSATFSVTTLAATPAILTITGPNGGGSGTITATAATGAGQPASCGFDPSSQFIPLTGASGSPPAGTAPAGFTFPFGLFDFTLLGCAPGGSVTLTVTYPQPVPPGAQYWKYGPTSANPAAHWYVFPATFSGATATFTITDGGLGDDDLTANGTIVDQGGPGAPGAGGAPLPTPTLSEWALILLAMLTGLLGMRANRRRARGAA